MGQISGADPGKCRASEQCTEYWNAVFNDGILRIQNRDSFLNRNQTIPVQMYLPIHWIASQGLLLNSTWTVGHSHFNGSSTPVMAASIGSVQQILTMSQANDVPAETRSIRSQTDLKGRMSDHSGAWGVDTPSGGI